MEVKQEASSEQTCKTETDNETYDDGLLDVFKIEVKEEPKTESVYEDYVVVLKTEAEQDEHKFTPFEEKQTANEKSYSQEESKLKMMETLSKHSSDERNYMSQQDEGKALDQNMTVATGQES
uniref:Uncharacterized protein LOC114329782 isoform X2 n=1 Tax=Diabrotica virgifera virgifera TaxID=50390 RepID=A0A6P7FP94_DIAVI